MTRSIFTGFPVFVNEGDQQSVQTSGAVGDGVTDNLNAFQSALNSGAGVVRVPDGTYFLNGSITVPEGVHFIGEGKPKLIIMNQGGRGIRLSSHTIFENFEIELHGNLAKANATDYTAGAAGAWVGDVYSPTNTNLPLPEVTDVIIRNLTIRSAQVNPTGADNAFAIHGIAIWGNTKNVLVEHIDIRGRYISYFVHADWGTSAPRITPVTGAIVPYDDIWHPRQLTFRDIYCEGDYTWVFPSGVSIGLPVGNNGFSFSNPQQVRCERIAIKDISEAFWVKIGDGGTGQVVTNSDIPLDTEMANFTVDGLYIENCRNFGVQISNKSYTHNITGIESFGTDVDGIKFLFKNVTIVRGPTENAKGALLWSNYWTANVHVEGLNIVHPEDVTIPVGALASSVRLFNAKNSTFTNCDLQIYRRGVEIRGVIGAEFNNVRMISPAQDREVGYAWSEATIGYNLIATRSPGSDAASTTTSANYVGAGPLATPLEVEAASHLSLTTIPWDIKGGDTLLVNALEFIAVGDWASAGVPTVIRVEPRVENVASGSTVYHDLVVLAGAAALAGATSLVLSRVPWPIIGGAYIYTGTQVIETVDTINASTTPVTVVVRKLEENIAQNDVLVIDRTCRDVRIVSGTTQGYKTAINFEGGADSTPENITIDGHRFHRNGLNDMLIEGGGSINVLNSKFSKCNRSLNTSVGSNIRFSGTPGNITIFNNDFESLFDSKVRFNLYFSALSSDIRVLVNRFNGYNAALTTPACIFAPTTAAPQLTLSGNTYASGLVQFLPTTLPLSEIIANGIRLTAITNDTTVSIPAGWAIDKINIANTTANAITGGIKIGTTSGATDVVVAQAVGANALVTIADANILLRMFSLTVAQTLFIQDVTAWNSASLEIFVALRKVF